MTDTADFVSDLRDLTIMEGHTAVMKCETNGKDSTVLWLKEDGPLAEGVNIKKDGNVHTLTIQCTKYEHQGLYCCVLMNGREVVANLSLIGTYVKRLLFKVNSYLFQIRWLFKV